MLPPLVGAAVNVTLCPAHIVFVEAEIDNEGVTVGLMVMVMLFEVAVDCVTQAAFEVNTQVTTAPLVNVFDVNDAALVPAFIVFTFHW